MPYIAPQQLTPAHNMLRSNHVLTQHLLTIDTLEQDENTYRWGVNW